MVTTNKAEVVRSYFNQEGSVKTANNSLSTSSRGKTLYSYNTPIGYRDDNGRYYLNTDKYSSTTSSQQTLFKAQADARNTPYEEVSEATIREKVNKSE